MCLLHAPIPTMGVIGERSPPLTLAQQMHEQETIGKVRTICGELKMNRHLNLDEICTGFIYINTMAIRSNVSLPNPTSPYSIRGP
jgi:hypothetical protein